MNSINTIIGVILLCDFAMSLYLVKLVFPRISRMVEIGTSSKLLKAYALYVLSFEAVVAILSMLAVADEQVSEFGRNYRLYLLGGWGWANLQLFMFVIWHQRWWPKIDD